MLGFRLGNTILFGDTLFSALLDAVSELAGFSDALNSDKLFGRLGWRNRRVNCLRNKGDGGFHCNKNNMIFRWIT